MGVSELDLSTYPQMKRAQNKLSAIEVKNTKPKEKPFKLSDGGGMYLLINPNGSKYWRLKYRHLGKEKLLAIGTYPDVSLSDAREARDSAKKAISNGTDPIQAKREDERVRRTEARNSFETIAREWHGNQKAKWTDKHCQQVLTSLENDIFPKIGNRPVTQIKSSEVLEAIREIEKRGAQEIATRVLQRVNAVFVYAIANDHIETNPAAGLKAALKARKKGELAHLTLNQMPALLKALDAYEGNLQTILATKLLIHTFIRTGELRQGRWEEIDWDNQLWRVPAERMKGKVEHLVPLSNQTIALLRQLETITGNYELMFPSRSSLKKPMSDGTILLALKRMGFKTTGHGFRKTASTTLNEMGFNSDAIERQLAHTERDKVRAAYNKAKHLEERRKMMQTWADTLEGLLEDKNKIVPIQSKAAQ